MRRLAKILWEWWPLLFVLFLLVWVVSAAFGESNVRGGGGNSSAQVGWESNKIVDQSILINQMDRNDLIVQPNFTFSSPDTIAMPTQLISSLQQWSLPTNIIIGSSQTLTPAKLYHPTNATFYVGTQHEGMPYQMLTTHLARVYCRMDWGTNVPVAQSFGPYSESFYVNGDWELQVQTKGQEFFIYQDGKLIYRNRPASSNQRWIRGAYSNDFTKLITFETDGNAWWGGVLCASNKVVYPATIKKKRVAIFHDSMGVPLGVPGQTWGEWWQLGKIMGWDIVNFSYAGRGIANPGSGTNYMGQVNSFTNSVLGPIKYDAVICVGSANDATFTATLTNQILATYAAYTNFCPVGFMGRLPSGWVTPGATGDVTDAILANVCNNNGIPYMNISPLFPAWDTNAWCYDLHHYTSNALNTVANVIARKMVAETNFLRKLNL